MYKHFQLGIEVDYRTNVGGWGGGFIVPFNPCPPDSDARRAACETGGEKHKRLDFFFFFLIHFKISHRYYNMNFQQYCVFIDYHF